MSSYEFFLSIGEPFAAGLFELNCEDPKPRYANALKRFWENTELVPYAGGELYPNGVNTFNFNADMAFYPHYCNTYCFNRELMLKKSEEGCKTVEEEIAKVADFKDWPHFVGGAGWTHSFPNFARVLKEGLNAYRARVEALEEGDFKTSMLITLEGIEIYRKRCVELLKNSNAPQKLIDALEYVPNNPARNIYEAMVSLNFTYYVDGCDDIGPLDKFLLPYYKGEDLVEIIREFFANVDANDGWSGTLGPECNDITRMCIRAIHNGRRPQLQLLVTPETPEWVWEEAAASLATSCGQPSMYNYNLYIKTLHELMPDIPLEDLKHIAFGGCTETMLEGISAVGSDDAGINTALAFADWMRIGLKNCATYEECFESFAEYLRGIIKKTIEILNEHRRTRALYRPSIVRTLLVDDCIDNRTEFQAGGTRYMWSVINIAGVINVVDSLNVIKTLIYEEKLYTPEEFIEKLDAQDPEFLAAAKKCPTFGNDDEKADAACAPLMNLLADEFDKYECLPRGKFYPVSNQFTTYVDAGKQVRATPDGRCCGAPLCDSLGPIHGNDVNGPTAMLNSVAKFPLHRTIGTPIVNIRISKDHVGAALKPIVLAFFDNGGMQLQVSCLSRDEMLDAMAHPEKHKNLVVRIGGFSEYFIRLSPEMQETVIKRTEY